MNSRKKGGPYGMAECPSCGRRVPYYLKTGTFYKHRTVGTNAGDWCVGSGGNAHAMSARQREAMTRLHTTLDGLLEKYPGAGQLQRDLQAREAAGLPVDPQDQEKISAIADEFEQAYRQGGKELGISDEALEEWITEHKGGPEEFAQLFTALEGSRRTGGAHG